MRHGRLAVFLPLLWVGLVAPALVLAQDGLDVLKLVVAETRINPGAEQLVQVSLRNTGTQSIQAGLRLEIRDANDRRVGSPKTRRVVLSGSDEKREFFRFRVPNVPGRYAVRFKVYSPDFKHSLLMGDPVFYAPFVVGRGGGAPVVRAQPPPTKKDQSGPAKLPRFKPPTRLVFERPDLTWENLTVEPTDLLMGEPLHIRADLRNVGGDVTPAFQVAVDYFNVRQPNRLHAIARTTVQPLAPGEKIELEFEKVLPPDTPIGEYQVVLQADVGDVVEESDKADDRIVSPAPIRLSQIKLIFPEAGYAFEESGLFLFRWDSLRYDEFKVQISTDPNFSDPANQFDIPQGDKWTRGKEVVPLAGELPDMARGLMEKKHTHTIYWRVFARNTQTGETGYSQVRPFTIELKAKKQEDQQQATSPSPETPPAEAPASQPGTLPGPQEKGQ